MDGQSTSSVKLSKVAQIKILNFFMQFMNWSCPIMIDKFYLFSIAVFIVI